MTIFCSFCGKDQDQVRKMIAGPTVFICNECAVLCVEMCMGKPEIRPDIYPVPTIDRPFEYKRIWQEFSRVQSVMQGLHDRISKLENTGTQQ